ncbi:hypothetical protein GCM10023191_061040 [Actinoallomurus oryzae]|jgi:hypothetical protein|uniref:Uncharacterized protein n=1 Tax=Actinoallomurus oryzae TaxID=502180 RepID=A0ABP8QKY0_9ACTN
MGFDDFIDSAPSVLGAGLTTAACFAIPAAIPLAMMQGTAISDPAQIWHTGDRHTALAGKAEDAKHQLTQAVEKHAKDDKWDGNDAQAFKQSNLTPYQTALDQTSELHKGIGGSLGTLAKVYMGAGLLSATIGGIMAACAVAVAGVSWIPGVNAAAEGAATATAETSSGVFRTVLNGLVTVIGTVGRLLTKIKGLLMLAGLGFGGGLVGKTMLTGTTQANTSIWPGDPQPTAAHGK